MMLSKIIFIYFFLPVFMGIYTLVPSKRRSAAIALANILIIAAKGLNGIIFFSAEFLTAYFTAIYFYNTRKKPEKQKTRKLLLYANVILSALLLAIFIHPETLSLPDAFIIYGAAVIPLHTISYLVDVYRCDCEAQTDIFSLAAYISFFPSAGFGPVLKYKNFEKSFRSPEMSHAKAAAGIKNYIFGLAEYVLIGGQLEKASEIISETKGMHIGGASLILSMLIIYVHFCISILGMIHMGQGIAQLMGFPVKRCFSNRFASADLRSKAISFNMPFNLWLKDYVFRPIKEKNEKLSVPAFVLAVFLAAYWYKADIFFMLGSAALSLLIILESALSKKYRKLNTMPGGTIIRLVHTKAAVAVVVFICSVNMALNGDNLKDSLFASYSGFIMGNEFLNNLFSVSAFPLFAGLIIMSPAVPELSRKMNRNWLRAALPVIELVLILLCTTFIISA